MQSLFFMPYDNHGVQMVHPWGVEPQSSEPESEILSIELRVHGFGSANVRLFLYICKNLRNCLNLFVAGFEKDCHLDF